MNLTQQNAKKFLFKKKLPLKEWIDSQYVLLIHLHSNLHNLPRNLCVWNE